MVNRSKMLVPLESNQAIQMMKIGAEYRIDSRIVSEKMGLQHRALIQVLRKYQNRLEDLGVLTFEMSKPQKNSEGGRPETYVLLNRNQAMFAITLSRNTEQVVDFKFDLIKAFDIVSSRRQAFPYAKERLLLPPAEQDQWIFHVFDKVPYPNGRDVGRYLKWYPIAQARRRLHELAEQGVLVEFKSGRTLRYARAKQHVEIDQ